MITISVIKLLRCTYKQLYWFLYYSDETEYQIIIPRRYTVQKEGDVFVSIDFNIAAYTGYMLSQITAVFSYTVPGVFKKEPFYFQVIVDSDHKRRFTEVLYIMIQAFNPLDRCCMHVALDVESHNFFSVLTPDLVYRLITFGLYYTANKRLSIADKNSLNNQ
ncbi:MAG: hypothetical protein ABI402_04935 [Ferruginibacter sp.]